MHSKPFTEKEKRLARKMFAELFPWAKELTGMEYKSDKFKDLSERNKVEWLLVARWHLLNR